MATQKTPTLVELAEKLLEQARELEKVIPAPPTFQEDTLANLPIEHEKTRLSLIDTSEMFTALVRGSDGPYGRIMRMASYQVCPLHPKNSHLQANADIPPSQYLDEVALYAIHHFRIPHRVPLNSSVSYADLADQCQIDVDRLTSLLRMAITFHMFYEPTPGYIAHTADSRLLVADTSAFDFIGIVRMEHKPAMLKVNEALEKWPGSPEPFHAPYSLAHNTDKPMYLHLQQHPERLRQFAGAMTNITRAGARSIALIAKAYPWAALAPGSTVVDVGGGNGYISVWLAAEHAGLSFVVQDLPHASDDGIAALPAALRGRVRFVTHDFFTPQPVHGAEAYFSRTSSITGQTSMRCGFCAR